jgi:predicted PurR-regulated permease PerM
MGRAVSIHPLAIVLAIAAGGVLAGIVGALLAVPLVAFLNSSIRVLVADDPAEEAAELEAQDGVVIDAEPDVVPQKRKQD